MKYLLLSMLLASFFACSNATPSKNSGKAQNYLTFKFSEKPSAIDINDPNNWCAAHFGEAALISADPKNFYHRIFALSNIPSKIVIDYGHLAAAFMLNRVGDHVEIYTSDNLPACLSNKANFQIAPEGTSFRYNNNKEIYFDVYLEELPNGLQIAIDLPPNGGHGIAVVRCETCK